ncbi:MAG: hypothetical protein LBL48_12090 [Azoarcus sp.]|jgi:hypothetical protein|nr:hypothetical protein [Azoarcus sp.]
MSQSVRRLFCAALFLTASIPAFGVDFPFGLTQQKYTASTVSDEICTGEFAGGARLADWRDIERYFNEKKTLYDFFRNLELKERENAYVTLDGKGAGVYYATRHNGNKPEFYRAQATIFKHLLDLGAENQKKSLDKVLCVSTTGGELSKLTQLGGTAAATVTRRENFSFKASKDSYAPTRMKDTDCMKEYGEGWRLADWRDVEGYYNETQSLDDFFQNVEFSRMRDPLREGLYIDTLYITADGMHRRARLEHKSGGPGRPGTLVEKTDPKDHYSLMIRTPDTLPYARGYDRAENTPLGAHFVVGMIYDDKNMRMLCKQGAAIRAAVPAASIPGGAKDPRCLTECSNRDCMYKQEKMGCSPKLVDPICKRNCSPGQFCWKRQQQVCK